MFPRLRKAFAPPVFADPERTHTATILNALILFFLATLLMAAGVGLPFLYAAKLSSALVIAALAAILLLARAIMVSGHVRTASGILIVIVWLIFAALSVFSGGIHSANLVYLLSTAISAGLLLGTAWMIGIAGASSLFILILALLEAQGFPPPQPMPAPPLSRWIQYSFSLAMTLIVLGISLKTRLQALESARRELATRQDAEKALRRSEERFRAIYDSLSEAVFLHEADGAILDCNRGALEMFGVSRADILGSCRIDELSSIEEGYTKGAFLEALARSRPDSPSRMEWHGRRRDGSLFWMDLMTEPARIDGRDLYLTIARDIDERIKDREEKARLEEELRQAQKLESIGRLAGGIAHDFNNLLTGIMGNLDLALLSEPPPPLAARLQEARKAGERASELTRQLLAFSRRQLIEPEVLDLREILSSLSSFLSRILGENISLSISSKAGTLRVLADRSQIEHALINLATNARDAMPSGGSLEFRLSEEEVAEGRRPGVKAGPFVRLSVSDTGMGMSKEVMANIFEPFFTTKGRGKGTGLGLAMVFGAMAQNGGFVEVSSSPGQGSTFSLYLPRSEAAAAPIKENESAKEIPRGSESVVVVEDEPTVRAVVQDLLRGAGYRVRAFTSAEEALSALPDIDDIDLLLTDVILPGADGHAVAQAFQKARPSLRVLFVSGYPDDAIAEKGVLQKGLHFLPKPFSPRALAVKVRAVLDG